MNLAVRTLREDALKLTQQQFASAMGWAISTVVRYELTRPPKGENLAKLARIARENKRPDLAEVFEQALFEELGVTNLNLRGSRVSAGEPATYTVELKPTPEERTILDAVLFALRWKDAKHKRAVMKALEEPLKVRKAVDELVAEQRLQILEALRAGQHWQDVAKEFPRLDAGVVWFFSQQVAQESNHDRNDQQT